jgi:KAP family P-loop domain
MNQQELRRKIMSAFEPLRPARSDTYVDCRSVRGDWDISVELGSRIVDSEEFTCQLFSGHIGSGKSSELIHRLNDYLSNQGFLVVYFAANNGEMPDDVEYADILLACVSNLLKVLPAPLAQQSNSLVGWLQQNWEWIQQFIPERMTLEEVKAEANLGFGKLIATLKTDPDRRPEIRRKLNEKTQTLLMALNEFIDHAQQNLPDHQKQGIVMIVDSLDRVLSTEDEKRQSWRDIYISRSSQMRGLNCHVVYTVDIDMVYSDTGSRLQDRYHSCLILPMVTVRYLDGKVNRAGIDILRQLVQKRIAAIDPRLVANLDGTNSDSGEPAIFASPEILDTLCLMSSGRMRTLMHLVQDSLKYNEGGVTITDRSMRRALQELSNSYSTVVDDYQWEILARIAMLDDKITVPNNSNNFTLLRKGHLLEYRYYQGNKLDVWRDVHPLITMSRKFKEAREKLGGGS